MSATNDPVVESMRQLVAEMRQLRSQAAVAAPIPAPAVVVLAPEQLAQLVHDAVERALAAHRPAAQTAPELLSVGEVADQLRCSTRQVRRYVKLGKLRSTKLGTGSARLRIPRQDVNRLLANSTE